MKKIICAIALLTVTVSMSAQDKIVRKARVNIEEIQNLMADKERKPKDTEKMLAMMEETMNMITPTLTSPETKKELANAWDIKAKLHMFIFSPLLDNVINHEPTDTVKLAENIYASLDAKQQAYLAEKDAKEPKFKIANQMDVIKFRPYVAYCGQMFFQNGQHKKAVEAFRRWLDYPKTYTILENNATALAEDEQTAQIGYFTCLAAYFAKDYKALEEFMPLAKTYEKEKDQVNQLMLTAYIEQGDTASWLKAGRDIVVEDPAGNEAVAQNLLAYYFNKNDSKGALAFTEDLLNADPNSKIGNYAKGLVFMNDRKYQDAITFFQKAIDADPEFSDAYYNAGVCYSNIGYDMNDALTGKKMTAAQQKVEIDKVKDEYAKAEPFFLKVKELEPTNTHKWATRLSTVYYILGDKAKQKEMEDLIGE
jgi:tetratricopeptide (TPR) repeat protein